ncbi:MAG TPA: YbhB/YbcL family Raf kinase inhibitor-like protein [Candidatus Eisenbacteria bacterium]|jgi:Raf kinase inhibitor-like YbhB/YbcL family protein
MSFRIESAGFAEGAPIPARYTADDRDLSPPLRWAGAPEKTRSFALVCDDPDAPAGTWVHWVLYNVPADRRELPEGVPALGDLPDGSRQGVNDFRRVGYGGPSPPPGKPHRYFFRLYALDEMLQLKEKGTKKDLAAAMKGHVLAEAQLLGTYRR